MRSATTFVIIFMFIMSAAVSGSELGKESQVNPGLTTAVIERTLTYQGILKDNSGNPVGDANYNLTFRIYDAAASGTLLWTSPVTPIATSDGYFSALLGPIQLPFDIGYFLSIQVQGDSEMGQRQKITLSPYSAVTDTANYALAAPSDGGSNWNVSDNVLYTNSFWGISRGNAGDSLYGDSTHTMVNLGAFSKTGHPAATRKYSTVGGGQSNNASNDYAVISGGYGNLAIGRYSFVGGGLGNEAESTYSAISGGRFNRTFEYGFIGGGEGNLGVRYSSIGGGDDNMAVGEYSVISGGSQNEVFNTGGAITGGAMNTAYGDWTFVGGGVENSAQGERGAVVGGEGSVANNPYSFVGGGQVNGTFGDYGVIVGGRYNSINDTAGVICGGAFNRVAGRYSNIGGGMYDSVTATLGGVASGLLNRAGDSAGDTGAFVGGGQSNNASNDFAVIGGGYGNLANGRYSFVGGGLGNEAESTYSAISGGRFNRTFEYGFIGGGEGNLGIGYSSIGGGDGNMAVGEYSVVSGGSQNEVHGSGGAITGGVMNSASGDWTFVGGGVENSAQGERSTVVGGEGSTANNPYSFVGGGLINGTFGDYAAILGGRYNSVSDTAAVICGGAFNTTAGRYSTIIGGIHDTMTTFGDFSAVFGNNVYCNGTYRVILFNSEHAGMLAVNRDSRDGGASYPIYVGTSASNGNGAYLTAGGVWTNGSSRTFKENFIPYNGAELLAKISNLSLTSYNYINSTEKHFGPVAEEFVGAFDTGVIRESDGKRDDMYLSSGDVAGVALAGVQELLKQNQELRAENIVLKNKMADFERRLTELENR